VIEFRSAPRLILLCLVCSACSGEQPGGWSGDYAPCDRHGEIRSRDRLRLGVRFSVLNPDLAASVARALNFWSTVLEMEWFIENTRACSIAIVDGNGLPFKPGEVALAQLPGSPAFQGWIAFNPRARLSHTEQYLTAVHEIGHLLGLRHNENARSVMFYLHLEGPLELDTTDLSQLGVRHRIRAGLAERLPVTVVDQRRPPPD
jgi:hypothetical protein